MKKLLSFALVTALMLTCIILPVSANTLSPELGDTITDVEATQPNGTAVTVTLEEVGATDPDLVPTTTGDSVIAQRDVVIAGTPTYPITVTGKIAGVKTTSFLYVMAKAADNSVVRLNASVPVDGTISFTMDKAYTRVSFISAAKTTVGDDAEKVTIPAGTIDAITDATAPNDSVTLYLEQPVPVEIPASSVNKIVSKEMTLTIKSDIVNTKFDTKTLAVFAEEAAKSSGNVHILFAVTESESHDLNSQQTATVKKLKPVLCATAEVYVNGKLIPDFKGGKVEIAFIFTPEAGATVADYSIIYVKDNGTTEKIDSTASASFLTAHLTHFFEYAIVKTAEYNKVASELEEEVKSPTTGEWGMAAIAAAATLALIGVAILLKKKATN